MIEHNKLDKYKGDTEYNKCVNFDNNENVGISHVFDESDFENFIYNLKDWD